VCGKIISQSAIHLYLCVGTCAISGGGAVSMPLTSPYVRNLHAVFFSKESAMENLNVLNEKKLYVKPILQEWGSLTGLTQDYGKTKISDNSMCGSNPTQEGQPTPDPNKC
jgi:hypothetical protein